MSTIPIDDKLVIVPDRANIDARYKASNNRPYTSVAAAEAAINLVIGNVGLTVLVADENDPDYPKAKEYWVQPYDNNGVTAYHLVEKQPQIDTSGFATKQEVSAKQDALPSGTAGQALKKTASGVEWGDMPSIEDGENTAVTLDGTIHVSAVAAQEGEGAGAKITPHTGGGVDMQFTLPKGANGQNGITPSIDPTTKHWMIGNTDTEVVAEGQDGADAVNPFKGYYPSGVNKPATGAVGDYLYAPSSDQQSSATATIWYYDSTQTPPWTDTGIDVSAVVALEFGSGQSVSATKIKDENGVEVQGTADVLSAEAGATLKEELISEKDITPQSNINYSIEKSTIEGVEAYRWTIPGKKHRVIEVTPGEKYKLVAQDDKVTAYAFLTQDYDDFDFSITDSEDTSSSNPRSKIAPLVTDTEVYDMAAGEVVKIRIPVGCKYLYLLRINSASSNANTAASPNVYKVEGLKDKILTKTPQELSDVEKETVKENLGLDNVATTEDLSGIENEIINLEQISLSSNTNTQYSIDNVSGQDGWRWTIPGKRHKVLEVIVGDKYKIKANGNYSTKYAFLTQDYDDFDFSITDSEDTSSSNPRSKIAPLVNDTEVYDLQIGESKNVVIPEGCAYLYVLTGSKTTPNDGALAYEPTVSKIESIKALFDSSVREDDPYTDRGLVMKNFRYKVAAIERGEENVQCVIALIGDSITQHNNDTEGIKRQHSNYVEPLSKYLRRRYGNAGGGFYSFSESSQSQKMGCVDAEDAYDERYGTITYRDEPSGAMWLDAADATFTNGAYIILHVETPHDKFVIHYQRSSSSGKFEYAIDNGTTVEVDASGEEGHATVSIENLTDTAHTVRIDVTEGSVMLFGVDMQRTAPGVRVHKIGNKGSETSGFVNIDEDSFKDGFESLGVDTATILLGVNDRRANRNNTTVYNNIGTIIDRIRAVNEFCDICLIQPTGGEADFIEIDGSQLKTRDFTEQSKFQKKLSIDKNCGFINLFNLFGSAKQIWEKGTFSYLVNDVPGVHPTLTGGRMIADYLIQKLFFVPDYNPIRTEMLPNIPADKLPNIPVNKLAEFIKIENGEPYIYVGESWVKLMTDTAESEE